MATIERLASEMARVARDPRAGDHVRYSNGSEWRVTGRGAGYGDVELDYVEDSHPGTTVCSLDEWAACLSWNEPVTILHEVA